MNEETNVKWIQQAYQSIQTRDMPSFLNLLTEDVVWIVPDMPNVAFAGTWHGRKQVGEFFHRVAEVQDVLEFKPEEFIAQHKTVVVLGHFMMQVKATGKPSRSEWVHVWKFEGDKVSYMREYVDTLAVSRAHTLADHVAANA